MTRFARGLDGCPAGWVVVTLQDGRVAAVEVVPHVEEVLDDDRAPGATIGMDIPIGLLDTPNRAADVTARRLLPERFPGDADCAPDDVLDAAVCAWVADGSAAGGPLLTVPDRPTEFDRGRPIVIHARRPPLS